MPDRVKDLPTFLKEIANLLELISRCRDVLFRAPFRRTLPPAIDEAVSRLRELVEDKYIRNPSEYREMQIAGLSGNQLELKLESFQVALSAFEFTAGEEHLQDALDKAGTILGSLAGAIPGFGSFAQELVEFLLKELRKRFRIWRR